MISPPWSGPPPTSTEAIGPTTKNKQDAAKSHLLKRVSSSSRQRATPAAGSGNQNRSEKDE
jgi:hypothetical protein